MIKKLIVLGSINIDHILTVKQFPKPGETLTGSNYQIAFGGKGANQAVAAGRGGANIQLIAAVGEDEGGRQIRQQLQKDQIQTASVSTITQEKTGIALIFVNAQGENEIVVYPGANAAVTPPYLVHYAQDIAAANAILIQLEIPLPTIEAAVKLAKAHHTQVIVNPAPATQLSDKILKHIDIITPNETEAESLTGIKVSNLTDADSAAQALHQKGIPTVIITLGHQGAWVSVAGKGRLIAGFQVNAIDTIAAGDTFNGLLVTALLAEKSLDEAVTYAHAGAAIAVTRSGAQPSIPWRDEIDAFLAQRQAGTQQE
ncbi:ribokinase [Utexia brackfieldae]|uniref:ribokinase n=1 Tax=Utexia brackfieldae TaxID=3074108 RepID=UPI00370D396E